jgi:predicted ATPase
MKLKRVRIANYRCFSSEPEGFSDLGKLNLIIGRNNSGKSRLLDLIRYLCDPKSVALTSPTFLCVEGVLEEEDLSGYFLATHSGGDINGNHWDFGRRFVGKSFKYQFLGNGVISTEIEADVPTRAMPRMKNALQNVQKPFLGNKFVHIAAERSIQAEPASGAWVGPDGSGATAVIQRYLSNSELSSDLIEVELLAQLNAIFEPDNRFTRILVQRHGDDRWEVYLEEEGKGRIPLSASGSGLQTVLLILLNLYTVPTGVGIDKGDLVLAIEEPENNLHPALQRRLLSSLQEFANAHGATFFITTHSTVAIDQFVGQGSARLYHVRHDGKFAKVNAVQAYADGHQVLQDLDVRASDLLQSNGIIWVEGPTDRLYINKWIEVFSAGRLREGAHYQCVFYGGKLLSHLSVDGDLSIRRELIDLITINRNAAIVIDSDRKSESGRLNGTKSRVKAEFEKIGADVWVTKGREIENYICPQILQDLFSSSGPGRLESVMSWVLSDGRRKRVAADKITLASKVADRTTSSEQLSVLDLEDRVRTLVKSIERWNNI